MPIKVVCECGRRLDFKDEYAGREIRCPDCNKVNVVGPAPDPATAGAPRTSAGVSAEADPIWDRDKFLLKQQALRISETYDVVDEGGQQLLFVQRPAFLIMQLVALGAGVAVFMGLGFVGGLLAGFLGPESGAGAAVVAIFPLLGIFAGIVVATMIMPKRHVNFYRDSGMRQKALHVQQDAKWQPIVATYTVKDDKGRTIALLRKNYFFNLFRKKWVATTPGGAILLVAREDSVILSLLRRLLGPLLGLLRAHFMFYRGDSDVVIGEFNRQFTLLDRYVLDLTRDPRRQIDRRLALALGVMLDTGERR